MKRIFLILSLILISMCFYGCGLTSRQTAEYAQEKNALAALGSVEIPQVTYFQERRTIAKWAQRWDKANIATYVYLFSYGNIIGYYIADGKPASTRSYLTPEEKESDWSTSVTVSAPDIDGTYGENNPGIRFFTADGAAVEWGGSGASYLYSDVPLPINAPKLNVVVETKTK